MLVRVRLVIGVIFALLFCFRPSILCKLNTILCLDDRVTLCFMPVAHCLGGVANHGEARVAVFTQVYPVPFC